MVVTREWIEAISDEQGLTKGQQALLKIHLKEPPYVDRLLDDFVARFMEQCRGYRGMTAEQKALIYQWRQTD